MIDPSPQPVYLDTSVVSTCLIPAIAHHDACVQFCTALGDGHSRVVCSDILHLEFGEFWFRLPRTSYLDGDVIRTFRLGAWDRNVLVRRQWMEEGRLQLEQFLARFEEVVQLPFTIETWRESIEIMARHRLRSHDAIHVATALAAGVPDFATVDADFRRVPALRLHLLRNPGPAARS